LVVPCFILTFWNRDRCLADVLLRDIPFFTSSFLLLLDLLLKELDLSRKLPFLIVHLLLHPPKLILILPQLVFEVLNLNPRGLLELVPLGYLFIIELFEVKSRVLVLGKLLAKGR
jgi:hypothetical protein